MHFTTVEHWRNT